MSYSTLHVESIDQHIVLLTLQRESSLNAINSTMMAELLDFWKILESNKTVRAVILTGQGQKAFCAGADIKERYGINVETWEQQHAILERSMRAMMDCPVPVLAAVNGVAFGGGLELVLASDFAYAASHATFGQTEVKLGIMPGAMGTQNLPRAVGSQRAKELTYTGDTFSAAEALEWGVLNKVVEKDELLPVSISTARKIANNAPLAVRAVKKSINQAAQYKIMEGYDYEVQVYKSLLPTQDRKEGINAFNEKRQPHFKGE